jgi:outer membrane protein TolC
MSSLLRSGAPAVLAVLTSLLVPAKASALQPLGTFLEGARERNPDAVVADATFRQREAEVDASRARLLPAFTARGAVTHNQYEAVAVLPGAGKLTIIPQNQLDAFFTLDVPLVDLAQFSRYDAQKLQRELADAARGLTRRQLDERVVRSYYMFNATAALVRATGESLAAAEKNLAVVKEKAAAGVAPPLDLERATASVERARQDVAEADLSRTLAARSLETVSRITPEPVTSFPEDDLHGEPPLPVWLGQAKGTLPELRVAEAEAKVAEANRRTARYAYAPSLSAQAQERLTNATGFTGRIASYTLMASLSFHFDLGTVAQEDVAKASADVTRARAEGTRRSAEDAIVEAWHRIAANVAKARAARAQYTATASALRIAEDRYGVGAATQLDVTQAQREAFAADVARIQSDLDLTQSRAVLRLASGVVGPTVASGSSSGRSLEPVTAPLPPPPPSSLPVVDPSRANEHP